VIIIGLYMGKSYVLLDLESGLGMFLRAGQIGTKGQVRYPKIKSSLGKVYHKYFFYHLSYLSYLSHILPSYLFFVLLYSRLVSIGQIYRTDEGQIVWY
jgi:hypothetical protein